ncbi:APC family permease [Algoriphagus sediminis]|uniref:APC family permease n=1 Tax=Algoriphagus sediminis TaxID=3057113 RepID=A0ABT7YCA0_9BACT|nr:APC family permease [Algoriphagus sediminis]MDN3204121.1 APC family permease [Algoriphagus sediminis]
MSRSSEKELKKDLGIWDVITNVLSISIGSGIFLLPALVYVILGHGSILAYIACGLIFLSLGLCFGEVSSRIDDTGGVYVYIERAFGPVAGFVANILYWFGVSALACAALLNAMADIASTAFPAFEEFGPRFILFTLVLGVITFLSIRGIKNGMTLIKILTGIKVFAILALLVFGISSIQIENISWQGFPEFPKIGEASLLLIFAFLGGELSLVSTGEMKNPKRTAPLGFVLGIIGVIFIFCCLHLVVQGVLGDQLIENQEAPLAELAKNIAGESAFFLLLTVSFIAVWSTFSSIFVMKTRVLYAGSADGLTPSVFSSIHPKFKTPVVAIVFLAILDLILAASGSFRFLLVLVTVASILMYLGVILAFFKFRLIRKNEDQNLFKVPLGYIVGTFAFVSLIWILFQSSSKELWASLIFILSLTLLYFIRKFVRKRIS